MNLQVTDIQSDDISTENGKSFLITIYGKTEEDKSVICNVIGYKPYFYMKIPETWSSTSVMKFITDEENGIQNNVKPLSLRRDLCNVKRTDIQKYKELYGFRCDENKQPLVDTFVKLQFTSFTSMKRYIEAIKQVYSELKRGLNEGVKISDPTLRAWMKEDIEDNFDSYLYESNVHPVLRFIHETGIEPANWITVNVESEEISADTLYPNVDICLDMITIDQIKPYKKDEISKYIIASFDIECDSAHGDFPLPNKDFRKLAIDIYEAMNTLHKRGMENYITLIEVCVEAGFNKEAREHLLTVHNIIINQVYTKDNTQPTKDCLDYCVQDFKQNDYQDKKQRDSVIGDMTKLLNKMKDSQGKCIRIEGDKVIQIGTVFQKYGEDKPYLRHILVIGNEDNLDDSEICSDLDGIVVERKKTELDLLLGWKDIIKQQDPDYITGYNIFGFDFGYLMDRIKVYCNCGKRYCSNNCPNKLFMNLGKINSLKSFQHRSKQCCEKKMKSSSFGNLDYKRYIHMDGRIIYDLQKEVEKGHNLESYKLDNVAAHFMRGKITKIRSIKIIKETKQINDKTYLYTNEFGQLKKGDYVSLRFHSNIGETYYRDNRKLKIIDINRQDDPYLCICGEYMGGSQLRNECGFTESLKSKRKISTWIPGDKTFKIEWCLVKDDVSPQDIFNKHKLGGPEGRAEVAKYCIQDCELCINLTLALDIIPNNIAMANVCSVPQSYIYLRGQGAKIFSLISRVCNSKGVRIPTLVKPFTEYEYNKIYKSMEGSPQQKRDKLKQILIKDHYKAWCGENWLSLYDKDLKNNELRGPKNYKLEDDIDIIMNPPPRSGYEGAIVLDPSPGIYLDDPVGVVDYASLYPSSIIEKNISHDTIIVDDKYLSYLKEGEDYETITYANYKYVETEGKVTITKEIDQDNKEITCHFLKRNEGDQMGIIPDVVSQLLGQRKATKKRLKEEKNEFKKKVLDGLQLSYKLVANSVYGQMGAKTSPIYYNKLAACTTSIGRQRIYDAREGVEGYQEKDSDGNLLYHENGDRVTSNGWWDDEKDTTYGGKAHGVMYPPKVIYGDTDSVFIKWSRWIRRPDGREEQLQGEEALKQCIEWGKAAGKWVTEHRLNETFVCDDSIGLSKAPQDLEYEKTFFPFILISKKRYVADKYEFKASNPKRNSMGIVLKRRDNAPIVKHVFGNVIEKIMIDKNLTNTVEWLKDTLKNIRNGSFSINNFIITKSLRGYYKNPSSIAHKVLADRIGERDPGNKPKAGDRMPFAYVKIDDSPIKVGEFKNGKPKYKKRHILQGDRVEDPNYILKHKLDLDYEFYITNQIMNPVKQVLDLGMDEKLAELIFSQ